MLKITLLAVLACIFLSVDSAPRDAIDDFLDYSLIAEHMVDSFPSSNDDSEAAVEEVFEPIIIPKKAYLLGG
uniref:Venom peptide Ld4a n=1 Tax=Lethocerus distinctifemur TaxID=280095 RepID=A0A2K8JL56_9HEMI|nr:venom peptide Ld4a [Lethocerus distinctifemur]